MEEILEILEQNSRYTDEQIAVMAGKTVEEVREAIRDYEEKSTHNISYTLGQRMVFTIWNTSYDVNKNNGYIIRYIWERS